MRSHSLTLKCAYRRISSQSSVRMDTSIHRVFSILLVQEAGLEPARTLRYKGFSYYYSFHYQPRNAWRILVVCSLDSILTILEQGLTTSLLNDHIYGMAISAFVMLLYFQLRFPVYSLYALSNTRTLVSLYLRLSVIK